jgi:hypothetical protein
MTVFVAGSLKSKSRRRVGYAVASAAVLLSLSNIARADEGGISFWLPGQSASFAASPQVPGWANV